VRRDPARRNSRYVERAIRHEVLAYVDAEAFRGKRILDFGCGAGASTLVMSRLSPPCEIVGVELAKRLLGLANLRAAAPSCLQASARSTTSC
jgi:tRNA1(Val) A37 N6-methylase TrmN6